MPIAKITGQGLAAMACSVALLWACIIADGILERRASEERARILHEIQVLQHNAQPEPVSLPAPLIPRTAQQFAG